MRLGSRMLVGYIAIAWLLLSLWCCDSGVGPTPPPSPPPASPTPEPPPFVSPVRIVGGRFVPTLIGLTPCCRGDWGFPSLPTEQTLRELAEAGGTWVHVRMGPFHPDSEGGLWRDSVAFRANGEWDQDFFDRRRSRYQFAASLGIAVEIDVLDGYLMRKGGDTWNWWREGCEVTRHAPRAHHIRFVEKLVQEFGGEPNVLWTIGNELSLCSPAAAWEKGIAAVLRRSGKLVGSDRAGASWADFDVWHSTVGRVTSRRASEINEHPFGSFEEWYTEAAAGAKRGIPVHIWPELLTEEDRRKALEKLVEVKARLDRAEAK